MKLRGGGEESGTINFPRKNVKIFSKKKENEGGKRIWEGKKIYNNNKRIEADLII